MKITKFPQSCLVIEKGDTRIVIDPGVPFSNNYDVDDLDDVDAVLYTHKHQDHLDKDIVDRFTDMNVPIYANESTADMLDEDTHVVVDGDEFQIGDFDVVARELAHCKMPDGSEGPQNTGFVIDGVLFHPGDGTSIEDLVVNALAVPIAGPSVSIKDAFDFGKEVGAKILIPIHYDVFLENPNLLSKHNKNFKLGFDVRVLENEDSTDL